MSMALLIESGGYPQLLTEQHERVRSARIKAALMANEQLLTLYWNIGKDILARGESDGWNAEEREQLSLDLRRAFPDLMGLCERNLGHMRDFAQAWPTGKIEQQIVARLPWGHNILLLREVKGRKAREWYAHACIQHGWSRKVFERQIETLLYERDGRVTGNYHETPFPPKSALTRELLKDPYHL
ncbi:MAG: putative nuclease of restriction endonuclease-like (RecB) superfamily [Planctomycetota bacterium]|jgi:predicted nuclease of restriction endonuclease-like (RecB) superfamily